MGLVGQEEQPGPILSLVGAKSFDRIILFSTPGAEKNTQDTKEALHSLYPGLEVEVRDLSLADPTDYIAILKGLRTHLREICETTPKAHYFIAVASGTPQMHACWVLLAARRTHTPEAYAVLSVPILRELQERERDVLPCLSQPPRTHAKQEPMRWTSEITNYQSEEV